MRPHFNDDKALKMWMEVQLEHMMREYAAQLRKPAANADRLLEQLKKLENNPEGFFQFAGILGKPRKDFSWEELREEAYAEKYGV